MSKIVLKGYILVSSQELPTIQRELNKHIQLTRQEPGCLIFEVNQDIKDNNRFNVYEEFVDQYAFKTHQQRVRTSEWGRLSHNVERHYQIIDDPS